VFGLFLFGASWSNARIRNEVAKGSRQFDQHRESGPGRIKCYERDENHASHFRALGSHRTSSTWFRQAACRAASLMASVDADGTITALSGQFTVLGADDVLQRRLDERKVRVVGHHGSGNVANCTLLPPSSWIFRVTFSTVSSRL
jgi:hypothetical protein